MRHRIAGGQLNRTSAHRVALRRNLAASLFEHETISTTMPKAKHVKSFAEKLITLAKKGDLASRRRAIAMLGNRDIVEEVDGRIEKKGTIIGKLFSEIGPRYLDRAGGYTRIIKLAKRRLGDNSPLVLLQLVGQEKQAEAAPKKGGKKKTSKKKTDKKQEAEE
ncbi:MAG: 50S ribosomal protein L17 [Phycisphaerae bacterium]|nr:50S ribosomal protein L17 [Phycisphaerae bacterium]